jgi:type III secretion protein C
MANRAALFFAFVLLCCSGPARATTPDAWKDTVYGHPGASRNFGEALSQFADSMGLRLQMGVPADVSSQTVVDSGASTSPARYLDRLTSRQYLVWFVYGGVLYVESAKQLVTRRIELRGGSPSTAKQALIGIGLFELKFGWGELDDASASILVTGPDSYFNLIREALERLPQADTRETQFMVFQLKHASVMDYETTTRDKVSIRPGVASVLRSLLGNSSGSDARSVRSVLEASKAPIQVPGSLQSSASLVDTPSGLAKGGSSKGPTIEAYPATNSIVVRDSLDRKPMYEQLIATLDQPSLQVEIFATIVDAEDGTLREWSADLSLGSSGNGAQTTSPISGTAALAQPNVVLWAANAVGVRLKALESSGKATVVSRPSILTLNNQGATLDLSTTAYLKLVGERVADTKEVTVGSLLNVTPRVIGENDHRSVLLNVSIEDGTVDTGSDVPEASRNSINTQAIVGLDEALVIGGFHENKLETNRSAVPILSAIPLIGGLFKSTYHQTSTRERLYIISARVVSPP